MLLTDSRRIYLVILKQCVAIVKNDAFEALITALSLYAAVNRLP